MPSKRSHSGDATHENSNQEKSSWLDHTMLLPRGVAIALLLVSPWVYGMVSWSSQRWCVGLVAGIFAVAILYACVKRNAASNWMAWSLSFLVLLALAQTISLPEFVWSRVAPGAWFEQRVDRLAEQFLSESKVAGDDLEGTEAWSPLAPEIDNLRAPRTVSVHPRQTLASLSTFACGLAMLVASGVLFGSRKWAIVLLTTIAAGSLVHAFLALVQSVSWNGWTLFEMPPTTYFGTFVSRNSAPQYYASGIGALMGLLVAWRRSRGRSRVDKRYQVRYPAVNMVAKLRRHLDSLLTDLDPLSLSLVFGITLLVMTVFATASRGGILACLLALIVTILVSVRKNASATSTLIGLATMTLIAGLLATSLGLDEQTRERLGTISNELHDLDNGRLTVWKSALSQPQIWLLGSGLGTFHFAILPAFESGVSAWYYHAESIPVELLSGLGLPGLIAAAMGLVWLAMQLLSSAKQQRLPLMFVPALFTVSQIGIHSLVDFSLILPAVFLPLAAIVGSFLGQPDVETHESRRNRNRTGGHNTRAPVRAASEATENDRGQATIRRRSNRNGTLVCNGAIAVIVGLAYWAGWESLCGFAASEDSSEILASPAHPEMFVHNAILRQSNCQAEFAEASIWPSDLSSKLRGQLSQPETLSASFRAKGDAELGELKRLALREPNLLGELQVSCSEMSNAARFCPMDWRASWGMLRGDLGLLSPRERARNYARLSILMSFRPNQKSEVGTIAIAAGERAIGLGVWQQVVRANTSMISSAAGLATIGVSTDELNEILPDSPFERARLVRGLLEQKKSPEFASEFASGVDLVILQSNAKTADEWALIAFLANYLQRPDDEIQALGEVVRMQPMDHRSLAKLAMLMVGQKRFDEANELLEDAVRRAPAGVTYSRERDVLKEKRRLAQAEQ